MNNEAGALWCGLVIGLVVGMFAGGGIMNSDWRKATIDRNLAQYCPADGAWAWKGECDK